MLSEPRLLADVQIHGIGQRSEWSSSLRSLEATCPEVNLMVQYDGNLVLATEHQHPSRAMVG